MSGPKLSNSSQVATVFFKGGGERDIHCDVISAMRNGFQFQRVDGSFEYVSADIIDTMEVVPAAEPVGVKQ